MTNVIYEELVMKYPKFILNIYDSSTFDVLLEKIYKKRRSKGDKDVDLNFSISELLDLRDKYEYRLLLKKHTLNLEKIKKYCILLLIPSSDSFELWKKITGKDYKFDGINDNNKFIKDTHNLLESNMSELIDDTVRIFEKQIKKLESEMNDISQVPDCEIIY